MAMDWRPARNPSLCRCPCPRKTKNRGRWLLYLTKKAVVHGHIRVHAIGLKDIRRGRLDAAMLLSERGRPSGRNRNHDQQLRAYVSARRMAPIRFQSCERRAPAKRTLRKLSAAVRGTEGMGGIRRLPPRNYFRLAMPSHARRHLIRRRTNAQLAA
jgi:hypothetical protein